MRSKVRFEEDFLKLAMISSATFLIALSLSRTLPIAIAISLVATSMAKISAKRSSAKSAEKILGVLPEIIDHLISGIQSGLSLSETLGNLATRGPSETEVYFQQFRSDLKSGMSFEQAISLLQSAIQLRAADQLFESLIFAKNLGGSELLSMLRQLGDFTRQDLALRREIAAKQGWIRNSAHLSAAAPWILLLLLAAQPSTGAAFTTPQGVAILGIGAAMTALAYLWMGKLSALPEPKRIFGEKR
jgi:tight adherence protein B